MNEAFHLLPERASNLATPYDALFWTMTILTAILTAGIAATIFYFAVKYRRRRPDEIGQNTGDHIGLEITWAAIPLLICLHRVKRLEQFQQIVLTLNPADFSNDPPADFR